MQIRRHDMTDCHNFKQHCKSFSKLAAPSHHPRIGISTSPLSKPTPSKSPCTGFQTPTTPIIIYFSNFSSKSVFVCGLPFSLNVCLFVCLFSMLTLFVKVFECNGLPKLWFESFSGKHQPKTENMVEGAKGHQGNLVIFQGLHMARVIF